MTFEDKPKLLGNEKARRERLEQINEPHVKLLTEFVKKLREKKGLKEEIPYFDPWDGGIKAKVLYLLEAPGSKAVYSGFISRNNPDESAKNTFELSQEAGLDRKQVVIWNIVPWYLGDIGKIRSAKSQDIQEGLKELQGVLNILTNLSAVALIGKKAQHEEVKKLFSNQYPKIKQFTCPHPSPQCVNPSPRNKEKILSTFKEISEFIRL